MEEEGKQRLLSSLQPIRLDDKATFDLAFGTLKQPISDYCFACSYMWAEALRTTWALLHRHVCVFANGAEDLTLLSPPIGLPGATTAEFAAAITDSFEIMDDYNAAMKIYQDMWAARQKNMADLIKIQQDTQTAIMASVSNMWAAWAKAFSDGISSFNRYLGYGGDPRTW